MSQSIDHPPVRPLIKEMNPETSSGDLADFARPRPIEFNLTEVLLIEKTLAVWNVEGQMTKWERIVRLDLLDKIQRWLLANNMLPTITSNRLELR